MASFSFLILFNIRRSLSVSSLLSIPTLDSHSQRFGQNVLRQWILFTLPALRIPFAIFCVLKIYDAREIYSKIWTFFKLFSVDIILFLSFQQFFSLILFLCFLGHQKFFFLPFQLFFSDANKTKAKFLLFLVRMSF
jgi:hypothetical protein